MGFHLSSPTAAEERLAKALKDKKLAFERNQTVEGYEVDFFLPAVGLIVEVDGYSHLSGQQLQLDLVKDNRLIDKGYLVTRFTNQQIREELPICLRQIEKIILTVMAGQNRETINVAWKNQLREAATRARIAEAAKPARRVLKKPQTIEEYFLSKEEEPPVED